jgi:hypothetical protein
MRHQCLTIFNGLQAGVLSTDAAKIDTNVIQRLNRIAQKQVNRLAGMAEYQGRIAFADPYSSPDVVPQNCTGNTPGVSVNGVLFTITGAAKIRSLKDLGKAISTATFHPTKAGQDVMANTVETAFESLGVPAGSTGTSSGTGTGGGTGTGAPSLVSLSVTPTGPSSYTLHLVVSAPAGVDLTMSNWDVACYDADDNLVYGAGRLMSQSYPQASVPASD